MDIMTTQLGTKETQLGRLVGLNPTSYSVATMPDRNLVGFTNLGSQTSNFSVAKPVAFQ